MAARSGAAFGLVLRLSQVFGKGLQHLLGVVAQFNIVHGECGRLDGARKIFPGLQDRFQIIPDKIPEAIFCHYYSPISRRCANRIASEFLIIAAILDLRKNHSLFTAN